VRAFTLPCLLKSEDTFRYVSHGSSSALAEKEWDSESESLSIRLAFRQLAMLIDVLGAGKKWA
jgi:hypothetical protein